MGDGRVATRKIRKPDKVRISDLALQGYSVRDIADRLGFSPNQISAFLTNMKRMGKLPPAPHIAPELSHDAAALPSADPMPAPPPVEKEEPPMPSPPGLRPFAPASFQGFDIVGAPQGAPGMMPQQPQFRVERLNPPDGYLGSHLGEFNPDELGRHYGEGHYRVTILAPNRGPMIAEPRISSAFGESRIPKVVGSKEPELQSHPRPPLRAPEYRPSIDDFGRRPVYMPPQTDPATTEAIRQMGQIQQEVLKQRSGPENSVRDFYDKQAQNMMKMRDEERSRENERRKDDDRRFTEFMEADRQRHTQDMERLQKENESREKRIIEERKTLLEIENQRMQMVLQQSKDREDLIRKDMERTREEMEGIQEAVQNDLKQERDRMDKEFGLRRDHLEREHDLRLQMVKLKEEAATSGTSDQIVKSLEKILGEAGKHVQSVLEYKKTELAASSPGNVTEVPAEPRRMPPPPRSPAPEPEIQEAENMEAKIGQFLQEPGVRAVIDEWLRHIRTKAKAGSFVNYFLESLRDPEDHRLRKGCNNLVVAMRTRDWKEILVILDPALTQEEHDIFDTEEGENFYSYFRRCVLHSVDEWWDEVAHVSRYGAAPHADQESVTESEAEPERKGAE